MSGSSRVREFLHSYGNLMMYGKNKSMAENNQTGIAIADERLEEIEATIVDLELSLISVFVDDRREAREFVSDSQGFYRLGDMFKIRIEEVRDAVIRSYGAKYVGEVVEEANGIKKFSSYTAPHGSEETR